ncbi:cell division protein ZapB [Aliikangiella sp. G2MR2-5]|uniref:cell division protein ZapB n=1 Tax=Aliikangiella sp. G2MR2-5 TaxID=2788943 RepID=UPI0018AA3DBA|nr:cell division protein ZapB [Aliikangiella sp. G2MR2-5]
MNTSNLSQLEDSVSRMLDQFESLQRENRKLRQDRDSLIEKNKLASQKIEAMITKLKELG